MADDFSEEVKTTLSHEASMAKAQADQADADAAAIAKHIEEST